VSAVSIDRSEVLRCPPRRRERLACHWAIAPDDNQIVRLPRSTNDRL
jgi:hypothetical protein